MGDCACCALVPLIPPLVSIVYGYAHDDDDAAARILEVYGFVGRLSIVSFDMAGLNVWGDCIIDEYVGRMKRKRSKTLTIIQFTVIDAWTLRIAYVYVGPAADGTSVMINGDRVVDMAMIYEHGGTIQDLFDEPYGKKIWDSLAPTEAMRRLTPGRFYDAFRRTRGILRSMGLAPKVEKAT